MRRGCLVLALAVTGLTHQARLVGADPVTAVHIVSRAADSRAVADDHPKRERAETGVTMHAVLVTGTGENRVYYSDVPRIRLNGTTHETRPLREGPVAVWAWYRVEPTIESLSNTQSGRFRFERIEYAETMALGWLYQTSVRAAVTPTLTTNRGHGLGTMRFKLVAFTADGVRHSPGIEARRGSGSGGLDDSVHRVSLRADDSYLGYLTEMYGQPYIWASAGRNHQTHQSERLEGSDCADFVVYGWRRLGNQVPYTWTGKLPDHSSLLGRGSRDDDGVYRDRRGRPLRFTRAGDLVLFPRHVGVLVEDRGVAGALDDRDIIFHTLFASPDQVPIADSGYADRPLELRRWIP